MLRNSQTNAPGGQRPKPRFKIEKRRNRAPRFMRQLNSLDFSRFRKKNDIMRRPSVAFADYEIKDKRSSIMSSLLLLSALMEGVASFVLPIIDAFGPPKHVEHKFYFEVFQIIQFTASILALAYLQALMIYYDWKRQRREVLTQKLMRSSRDSSEEPYRTDEDRDNDSVVSVDPECSRTIEAPYQPVQIVENNVEISEDASSEVPPNADDEINQRNNSEITEEPQPSTSTESSSNGRNYNLQSRTVVIHDNDGDSSDETIVRKCSSESVSPKPLGKRRVTHLGRMFGDTLGTFSKSNPPFTQDNEGINLYLRLGAVVFGFGVMIMDGFRVADQFRAEKIIFACHSVLWIPVNLIHSVYVFWQTYFLFKYHRV
uniref:Otopetrin-2 n=1 Tax=Mesocestoides corti TaxID=53468 RepID=A0A5K3EP08_MESCO